MLKILHAADFHLDSSFTALSAEQASERRQESRQLPRRLVELAKEQQVDLLLLAGDLFDGYEVYRETVEELCTALGACPCPVLIATGNHDFYSSRSPWAGVNLPANVTLFAHPQITKVAFPELGCAVYGAGFDSPTQENGLLTDFQVEDDGLLPIMVLHGEVTTGESMYHPIHPQDIAKSGLRYLALGHIHAFSGKQMAGDTVWCYAGCPEGRGFDELGEKGCVLTCMDEQGISCTFLPLAQRRYQLCTVDITGREPWSAIQEALPITAKKDICRIVLVGERSMETLSLATLAEKLKPYCWQVQLRDKTHLQEFLWGRSGEDSLRGLTLSALRERYDKAESEEARQEAELAARYVLAVLDRREI